MKYQNVVGADFVERPNRFVATVKINGESETVHVKNTGRCKELLIPGCRVYLEKSANQTRKTAFDLIAVEKERVGKPPLLINMDSQVPNAAAEEWLKKAIFSPKTQKSSGRSNSEIPDLIFTLRTAERKPFSRLRA